MILTIIFFDYLVSFNIESAYCLRLGRWSIRILKKYWLEFMPIRIFQWNTPRLLNDSFVVIIDGDITVLGNFLVLAFAANLSYWYCIELTLRIPTCVNNVSLTLVWSCTPIAVHNSHFCRYWPWIIYIRLFMYLNLTGFFHLKFIFNFPAKSAKGNRALYCEMTNVNRRIKVPPIRFGRLSIFFAALSIAIPFKVQMLLLFLEALC